MCGTAYLGAFGKISLDLLAFVICEFERLNRVFAFLHRRIILSRHYQRLITFLGPRCQGLFRSPTVRRRQTFSCAKSSFCIVSPSSRALLNLSNLPISFSKVSSNIVGCTSAHCSTPAASCSTRLVMLSASAANLARCTIWARDFFRSSSFSRRVRRSLAHLLVSWFTLEEFLPGTIVGDGTDASKVS